MSFARGMSGTAARTQHTDSVRIMVSAWWLIWAFIVGGYAGMLVVALMVVARKSTLPDSAYD